VSGAADTEGTCLAEAQQILSVRDQDGWVSEENFMRIALMASALLCVLGLTVEIGAAQNAALDARSAPIAAAGKIRAQPPAAVKPSAVEKQRWNTPSWIRRDAADQAWSDWSDMRLRGAPENHYEEPADRDAVQRDRFDNFGEYRRDDRRWGARPGYENRLYDGGDGRDRHAPWNAQQDLGDDHSRRSDTNGWNVADPWRFETRDRREDRDPFAGRNAWRYRDPWNEDIRDTRNGFFDDPGRHWDRRGAFGNR
jgi:hypothetical protein